MPLLLRDLRHDKTEELGLNQEKKVLTKTLWRSEGQVVKLPKFAKYVQIMEKALGVDVLIKWVWVACDERQKE